MVKRLRHRPLTAGSRVRIPMGSPKNIFTRPYGQAVKTPPFHGGIPGSNPGRVTIMTYHHLQSKWNEGQTSRRFKVSKKLCQQADADYIASI